MGAARRVAVLALLLVSGPLTVARAQRPGVEVLLPPAAMLSVDPPAVRTLRVLAAARTAELIRNGFPARLHYRLERWAAGTLVNDVRATAEWEVIAEYAPLSRTFRLVRATSERAVVLGEFASIADADAKLAEPFVAPIAPPRPGERSYYRLTLEVQAMSLSDLEEARRWLRGEARPAVSGRRNPGTAVGRGLRMMFVRILGGERVQYETATGVFRP